MDNLIEKPFNEIDLSDSFFDSLRVNYPGFDEWFLGKAQKGESAYVFFNDDKIVDFLYLKDENEKVLMDDGFLEEKRRLKVGTFKIEKRGTSRGERFMKRILDCAVKGNFEEIYATMFDDTDELSHLRSFFEHFGFEFVGYKTNTNGRKECVLVRNMCQHKNDILLDYPFVNTHGKNKYVLSIYPEFHTKLFSDSALNFETVDILEDVSETNSIVKIYICWMEGVSQLQSGDNIIIYRTNDKKGSAYYRSVATSLCTVLEVKSNYNFDSKEDFVRYCNRYSIFEESKLNMLYSQRKTCYVIKMLYNVAFNKRVIRKSLLEDVKIPSDVYWGFVKLTNDQFDKIIELGEVDERYIID